MVHQDGRKVGIACGQPGTGLLDPFPGPCVHARVRGGIQHELVRADNARFPRPGKGLLLRGRARRAERVVVEQEQRRHDDRATDALPHRVGILRGQYAETSTHLHQVLVAPCTGQLHGILSRCPQLVVARNPDHRGEPPAQHTEGPFDVGDEFTDVTGDDQPVGVRLRSQVLHDPTVVGKSDMQVADGQQFPSRPERGHLTDLSVPGFRSASIDDIGLRPDRHCPEPGTPRVSRPRSDRIVPGRVGPCRVTTWWPRRSRR